MNAMRWMVVTAVACLGLAGLAVHADDANGDWMEMGQVEISSDDKDNNVQFKSEDRAVRAIRLRVGRHATNVKTITVVYDGNDTQTINVNQTLEPGKMTKVYDLEGHKRRIEKIVLKASVAKKEEGKAMLIIYGKKG